ncbi:hypothetical protein B0H13DRAFT_1852498 [Mycena leptocephala]|nr:hypothetical protein B0H13DRAFT_1852498 [Mycena leptocephala]
MPPQPAVTQVRLNNISSCLTVTADTLEILANGVRTPFLGTILNTTQYLLENIQAVKQNKNACTELMEQTHKLLNAILMVHINSDTGAELPPSMLKHVGRFMEILHKIHTFVEAQQTSNKVKKFFRQSEMSTLLKDCKAGLQKELDFFEIETCSIMSDIAKYYMQPLRSVDEVTYGNLKRKFSPKEVIAKDPGEISRKLARRRFYGSRLTPGKDHVKPGSIQKAQRSSRNEFVRRMQWDAVLEGSLYQKAPVSALEGTSYRMNFARPMQWDAVLEAR